MIIETIENKDFQEYAIEQLHKKEKSYSLFQKTMRCLMKETIEKSKLIEAYYSIKGLSQKRSTSNIKWLWLDNELNRTVQLQKKEQRKMMQMEWRQYSFHQIINAFSQIKKICYEKYEPSLSQLEIEKEGLHTLSILSFSSKTCWQAINAPSLSQAFQILGIPPYENKEESTLFALIWLSNQAKKFLQYSSYLMEQAQWIELLVLFSSSWLKKGGLLQNEGETPLSIPFFWNEWILCKQKNYIPRLERHIQNPLESQEKLELQVKFALPEWSLEILSEEFQGLSQQVFQTLKNTIIKGVESCGEEFYEIILQSYRKNYFRILQPLYKQQPISSKYNRRTLEGLEKTSPDYLQFEITIHHFITAYRELIASLYPQERQKYYENISDLEQLAQEQYVTSLFIQLNEERNQIVSIVQNSAISDPIIQKEKIEKINQALEEAKINPSFICHQFQILFYLQQRLSQEKKVGGLLNAAAKDSSKYRESMQWLNAPQNLFADFLSLSSPLRNAIVACAERLSQMRFSDWIKEGYVIVRNAGNKKNELQQSILERFKGLDSWKQQSQSCYHRAEQQNRPDENVTQAFVYNSQINSDKVLFKEEKGRDFICSSLLPPRTKMTFFGKGDKILLMYNPFHFIINAVFKSNQHSKNQKPEQTLQLQESDGTTVLHERNSVFHLDIAHSGCDGILACKEGSVNLESDETGNMPSKLVSPFIRTLIELCYIQKHYREDISSQSVLPWNEAQIQLHPMTQAIHNALVGILIESYDPNASPQSLFPLLKQFIPSPQETKEFVLALQNMELPLFIYHPPTGKSKNIQKEMTSLLLSSI